MFTSSDYSLPVRGTLATQPRNSFRGPSCFNTGLSLFKNFGIPWSGRSATAQLRLEAFNVFNEAHLIMSNDLVTPVTQVNNTTFGRVTSLRTGTLPRVLQLGVKFLF